MLDRQEKEPIPPCRPVAMMATLIAGIVRFLPLGMPNFTAVGSLALYGGARMPWYLGLAAPMAVMAITDRILQATHQYGPFNKWVYACYFVTALAGLLLRRTNSPWKIGVAAVFCDLMFFVVTNYGVWVTSSEMSYPKTWAGLTACYDAALPFHRNTVISTLVFVPLFFGVHMLALRWAAAHKPIATVEER